jgi:hypothetical protein
VLFVRLKFGFLLNPGYTIEGEILNLLYGLISLVNEEVCFGD